MESLCVVSGKTVWAIRIDLHILDNGGYVSCLFFPMYFVNIYGWLLFLDGA